MTLGELHEVLRVLSEPALAVSREGTVHAWNLAAQQVLGLDPLARPPVPLSMLAVDLARLQPFLRLCSRSSEPLPGALLLHGPRAEAQHYRCDGRRLGLSVDQAPPLVLLRLYVSNDLSPFILLKEKMEQVTAEVRRRREVEVALRQSEDRLRMALEAGKSGTWDLDLNTGELSWDSRCRTLMGLPEGAEVTYDIFLSLVHLEDRTRIHDAIQEALRAPDEDAFEVEYRAARAEEERWLSAKGRVYFEAGRAVRFIGTVRDVTEFRRREAEWARIAEFAQQLMGIVGHDLRNPLSAILSSASLLSGRVTEERLARPVSRIISSAERAKHLISDILDLTQAQLGSGIPLNRQQCNFHAIVRDAIDELHAAHPERDISLQETGDGAGEWDSARLGQVISNLLSNALKYSPPDSSVRVASEAGPEEVLLRIHNLGPPIPESLRPYLFQPFRRHARHGGSKGSLGLGLYIVERIITAHHGTIELLPEPVGTTFQVRLPRLVPAQETSRVKLKMLQG